MKDSRTFSTRLSLALRLLKGNPLIKELSVEQFRALTNRATSAEHKGAFVEVEAAIPVFIYKTPMPGIEPLPGYERGFAICVDNVWYVRSRPPV